MSFRHVLDFISAKGLDDSSKYIVVHMFSNMGVLTLQGMHNHFLESDQKYSVTSSKIKGGPNLIGLFVRVNF